MKKKIYFVSNSQGSSLGVELKQNYPYLLQNMMPETTFHYWIMSGGHVGDINLNIENILITQPDLVVFQIGIIECAQRILSNKEKDIFKVLPLGKVVTHKLHQYRKQVLRVRRTLHLSARMISPANFRSELQILTQKLAKHDIPYQFLETPRFSYQFEAENYPYLNSDIDLYNNILSEFGAIPFLTEFDDLHSIWQKGSVHFTPQGHQYVAQKVKTIISQQLSPPPTSASCP
jgi:lysophospholipase L1-like esterase